jgi:hypothetical protein
MCIGPVSLFLGLLATQLGLLDEAVQSLQQAIAFAEQSGALPCLALSLAAASRAQSLRQAPGDRDTASAYRARAQAIAGRLGMSENAQPAGRRPGPVEPAARRRGLAAAGGPRTRPAA